MRLKDAEGKKSTTLTFVVVAFVILAVKFLMGGLTLPMLGAVPVIGAGEFGMALTGILAIWRHREHTEKVSKSE